MKFLKKNAFVLAMIVALGGFAAFNGVGFFTKTASEAKYEYEGKPQIIAATFSSAWCSACKILEPKLAKVVPDFVDQPVRFVKLDFSLGQGGGPASIAQAYNFTEVYEQYKGSTGHTLLLKAETGEILDQLTAKQSENEMTLALRRALTKAAQS